MVGGGGGVAKAGERITGNSIDYIGKGRREDGKRSREERMCGWNESKEGVDARGGRGGDRNVG